MKNRRLLERLATHQDTVLAILRDKEPLLNDPVRRDVAALARTRWTLARALVAYGYFKHGEIFDPAIARQLLGEAQRAERMKRACEAMDTEFRAYVSKWSACDVAGSWNDYRPAALRIIARLRDHIASERAEITALLEPA